MRIVTSAQDGADAVRNEAGDVVGGKKEANSVIVLSDNATTAFAVAVGGGPASVSLGDGKVYALETLDCVRYDFNEVASGESGTDEWNHRVLRVVSGQACVVSFSVRSSPPTL